MNGATTDPFARIKSPAKITSIRMRGKSQSFFLSRRKAHISLMKPIVVLLELVLHGWRWRTGRLPLDPVGPGRTVPLQAQQVLSQEPHPHAHGGDRQEEEEAHH